MAGPRFPSAAWPKSSKLRPCRSVRPASTSSPLLPRRKGAVCLRGPRELVSPKPKLSRQACATLRSRALTVCAGAGFDRVDHLERKDTFDWSETMSCAGGLWRGSANSEHRSAIMVENVGANSVSAAAMVALKLWLPAAGPCQMSLLPEAVTFIISRVGMMCSGSRPWELPSSEPDRDPAREPANVLARELPNSEPTDPDPEATNT